jgi:thiamine-monophosphate kinase
MALTGEDRLLAWLRRATGPSHLGDDAAHLESPGDLAVTMDSQIEGVHFFAGLDPASIARRLLAVNLSDLAATAAVPRFAFLALSTPREFPHRRFFRALLTACRGAGVELAGGDLSSAPVVAATLTMLGTRPRGGRFLSRAGARPGHALWLGGTVGEAALGLTLIERGARLSGNRVVLPPAAQEATLAPSARAAVRRHVLPVPQLELGLWLGRQREGGALDLSDGLARDLHRLCRESKVGAELRPEALAASPGWRRLCEVLGKSPLELQLCGGEDYVLLFTLPLGVEPPVKFGCRRIGRIVAGKEVTLIEGRKRRKLAPRGWDHFNLRVSG